MEDEVKSPVAADNGSTEGEVARWKSEIALFERESEAWLTRSRKIVKRYKDERSTGQTSQHKFNVLWSNVQTLLPALYMHGPKPEVERRFKDKDPVGRLASEVLERALSFSIKKQDFDLSMRSAVLDRLLPGRGTVWARYQPHMEPAEADEGTQVTDDAATPGEVVKYEEVIVDYVHWEDFGHTIARTWSEVRGIWRRVFMTREELVARFGEIGSTVPLDWEPKNLSREQIQEGMKKAVVYEIWCKTDKRVYWLNKNAAGMLDAKDDPLRLDDFYPCPRPMFATLANDSLIPVPDYSQYQDQAAELDDLTGRIQSITKSLKAVGVYDAGAPALGRMLSEGVDNTLIPVDSWAKFSEKGGITGTIQMMPKKEVVETLVSLYEARDKVKQDLYEITGMSDIMRGVTDPDETYGAQNIKSSYGMLRLTDDQKDVQRFARDLIAIMGQLIAMQFGVDTLRDISGVQMLTRAEKMQIQFAMQQAQALQRMQPQGQPPQQMPPPAPPEKMKLMDQPAWEDVHELLTNMNMRQFRIDIETDSIIKIDEQKEQQGRTEFVKTMAPMMQQLIQAGEQLPVVMPLMVEVIEFVARSYKIGRSLEAEIESTLEKLKTLADKPKPDPNQGAMQIEQAKAQFKAQADQATQQARVQADQAIEQARLQSQMQMEQMRVASEERIAQAEQTAQAQQRALELRMEAQAEAIKQQGEANLQLLLAQMNNAAKVEVAEIAAQTTLDAAQISAAKQGSENG